MLRITLSLIAVAISLVAIVASATAQSSGPAPTGFELAYKETHALRAIVNAKAAGGNVSEKIAEFNQALELVRQSNNYSPAGCTPASNTCTAPAQALQLFDSISSSSDQVAGAGAIAQYTQIIIDITGSAAAALATSFIGTYLYERRLAKSLKELEGMRIRKKEEN